MNRMKENDYIAEYVRERRPEIITSVDYLTWRFVKAFNNCMDGFSGAIDKCIKEIKKNG